MEATPLLSEADAQLMQGPLLLFDGVCNLCSASVQQVLLHDRTGKIRFASLQSEVAGRLLRAAGRDPQQLTSLVFIQQGEIFIESDAAIRLGIAMQGRYAWLARFCAVFPRFIRNVVYRWVARNRYRLYGKKESCWLPRPEWRARFVDQ